MSVETMAGKVEKVIIDIFDSRAIAENVSVDDGNKASDPFSGKVKAIKQKASKGSSSVIRDSVRRYVVKFNPSTLSFATSSDTSLSKTNLSDGNKPITDDQQNAKVQISFTLLLDDYCYEEAFMQSARDITAMGLATDFAKLEYNKSKHHTVQYQVEALMEALRNPYLRRVCFYWGKLNYMGILNKVDATYTMFSTEGRPIRASVDIGILCDEKDYQDGKGPWAQRYKKAFENDGIGDTGKSGSILNDMAGKLSDFKAKINL